ncbi:uncharacterized protein LOC135824228 [Sycon ciliatum]|uniref:uncharacterized protein LOC135824228 n=1 Tax=Sycon ciliatum TaxID=27933 RepID=UPI0031F6F3D9
MPTITLTTIPTTIPNVTPTTMPTTIPSSIPTTATMTTSASPTPAPIPTTAAASAPMATSPVTTTPPPATTQHDPGSMDQGVSQEPLTTNTHATTHPGSSSDTTTIAMTTPLLGGPDSLSSTSTSTIPIIAGSAVAVVLAIVVIIVVLVIRRRNESVSKETDEKAAERSDLIEANRASGGDFPMQHIYSEEEGKDFGAHQPIYEEASAGAKGENDYHSFPLTGPVLMKKRRRGAAAPSEYLSPVDSNTILDDSSRVDEVYEYPIDLDPGSGDGCAVDSTLARVGSSAIQHDSSRDYKDYDYPIDLDPNDGSGRGDGSTLYHTLEPLDQNHGEAEGQATSYKQATSLSQVDQEPLPTADQGIYDSIAPRVRDDEQPYQEPPGSVEELYAHLQQPAYQQITRSSITIGKELGAGEFGVVTVGKLSMMGQHVPVAVKILKVSSVEAKKTLLQEAALMGQFYHSNVVRLVGVVTQSDPVMVILELMSGGNLRSYLHQLMPSKSPL